MSNGSQDNRLRVSDVISRAIDENRFGERLLYGFAIAFVAAGMIVLACGIFYNTFAAWAGIAESILFVPAVVLARRIREQNLALRMLEIPLRKARNAEEAAQVLTRFFQTAFNLAGNPTPQELRGS